MDQRTPHHLSEARPRRGGLPRLAVWAAAVALVLAALVGATLAGLKAGEAGWPLPAWLPEPIAGLLVPDQGK